MNIEELKSRVWAEIDDLQAEAVSIAADIHAHPELGWETHRSAGLLMDYMEKHGMNVERGIADMDVAFRGSIKGRDDSGPGIALLAEYDALPEIGHACSHNLIGTIAATAGIALSRVLGDDVPGNVYVMGCPFEEGGGGKIFLIERGAFDPADISIMWHGNNKVVVGNPNIASGRFVYKFHGKPAHAGQSPHEGVNAADAAMLTFAGVNALRQHVTPDSRISGYIKNGGAAANVTPEYAEVDMMTRAMFVEDVLKLRERVHNCARGAALMTGTQIDTIMTVGAAWGRHFSRPVAEATYANIQAVGLPEWSEADQALARGLQEELGVNVRGLATSIGELQGPVDLSRSLGGGDSNRQKSAHDHYNANAQACGPTASPPPPRGRTLAR